MLAKPESACLLIGDISGYTGFLASVELEHAHDIIADLIKRDRDAAYIAKNAKGETVNRVENISFMGSSNILSEECWVTAQFARSLGLVQLDHQARV